MRVKLGDVCERGTSNLKLSDVSELLAEALGVKEEALK